MSFVIKVLILAIALLIGITAGAWFGTSRRKKLERRD
jgi:uncharacterized protein YneF (UPF0154 family)